MLKLILSYHPTLRLGSCNIPESIDPTQPFVTSLLYGDFPVAQYSFQYTSMEELSMGLSVARLLSAGRNYRIPDYRLSPKLVERLLSWRTQCQRTSVRTSFLELHLTEPSSQPAQKRSSRKTTTEPSSPLTET